MVHRAAGPSATAPCRQRHTHASRALAVGWTPGMVLRAGRQRCADRRQPLRWKSAGGGSLSAIGAAARLTTDGPSTSAQRPASEVHVHPPARHQLAHHRSQSTHAIAGRLSSAPARPVQRASRSHSFGVPFRDGLRGYVSDRAVRVPRPRAPRQIPPTNRQQTIKRARPPFPAIRPLTCDYLVTGAGFEPATSGL
jgi:hypothetical protein